MDGQIAVAYIALACSVTCGEKLNLYRLKRVTALLTTSKLGQVF